MLESQNLRNVDVEIDASPLSRLQITVLILCFFVAAFDGLDAQIIAFAAPVMLPALDLQKDQLGIIFSAGTVGMAIGAIIFGALGDIWGRKRLIIGTVVLFGICTLATALVTNLAELLVIRIIAGIGMGGALPNAVTLVSEYSATRQRRMMVSIMYMGFTVGGIIGGVAAAQLIEKYGWQSIFYIGGILPLALTVLLLPFLPESLHYLAKKADNTGELISKMLQRINPAGNYSAEDRFTIVDEKVDTHIRNLFTDGRIRNTLLLWLAFFTNLLVLFCLVYWTPVLLVDIGLSYKKAVAAVLLFNAGGIIGALLLAWTSNRLNPYYTLGIYFCAGALSAMAAGLSVAYYPVMMFFIFCLGFTAAAAQVGLYPLATQIYPTAIRVTGVGWAQAWGRVGSIIGPLLGGVLVAFGFGFKVGYVLFGLPLFIAAIAIFFMYDQETNVR